MIGRSDFYGEVNSKVLFTNINLLPMLKKIMEQEYMRDILKNYNLTEDGKTMIQAINQIVFIQNIQNMLTLFNVHSKLEIPREAGLFEIIEGFGKLGREGKIIQQCRDVIIIFYEMITRATGFDFSQLLNKITGFNNVSFKNLTIIQIFEYLDTFDFTDVFKQIEKLGNKGKNGDINDMKELLDHVFEVMVVFLDKFLNQSFFKAADQCLIYDIVYPELTGKQLELGEQITEINDEILLLENRKKDDIEVVLYSEQRNLKTTQVDDCENDNNNNISHSNTMTSENKKIKQLKKN